MIAARSERRFIGFRLEAPLLLCVTAAWVFWRFPPEQYSFYPACPIHEYLHIECPGCGATRALAALLHGHLADALRLNALVIGVVLPLAVLYAGIVLCSYSRRKELRWPSVPVPAIYAMLGIAALFTLARNL